MFPWMINKRSSKNCSFICMKMSVSRNLFKTAGKYDVLDLKIYARSLCQYYRNEYHVANVVLKMASFTRLSFVTPKHEC